MDRHHLRMFDQSAGLILYLDRGRDGKHLLDDGQPHWAQSARAIYTAAEPTDSHFSRIIRFCGLVLVASPLNSAQRVFKVLSLTQLIGIDLVRSLLSSSQQVFYTVALTSHSLHLKMTSLNMQESTLGRTRIDEVSVLAAWDKSPLAADAFFHFRISGGWRVLSLAGEHSEKQPQAILLTTTVITICAFAASLSQELRATRSMLSPYDRSMRRSTRL
mmetsp:Transcript_1849/g.3816  ORF Transcript_1849/g.3816 Transcript_1849/m.3816 type:complete len:217 (+) Transcript_1849:295-945(+)